MAPQGKPEMDPLLEGRGAAGSGPVGPPPTGATGATEAPASSKPGPGAGSGELKVPRTILFIIGNEFCERFSYYGMRAILALYLNDQLRLSEGAATEMVHLFIVFCYLSPFLGAFISDSYWGKYRVILALSIVYCIGNWLVSLSAAVAPGSVSAGLAWAFLGLLFIALGSGGIKPCVSSFGGDQIELTIPPGPGRDRLLRSFFSYFYFAINVGSCFSMIIVPILRANVSYFSAFATPALLMMVALAIFYSGRNDYVHQPPSGNVVAQVLAIVWCALSPPKDSLPVSSLPAAAGQGSSAPRTPAHSNGTSHAAGKSPLAGEGEGEEEPLVVRTLHKRGSKRAVLPEGVVAAPHWLDRSKARFGAQQVEDVKQVLRVLLLFLPTPIFWSLWDQQASRWVFQASRMDGTLPFGFSVYPDQMQTINALGILAMIPLFDQVLYPLVERMGIPVKPIRRMALGMVFGALSFVMSALVEVWIQQCPAAHSSSGVPSEDRLGLLGNSTGAGQAALPSARSLLLSSESLSLGLGAPPAVAGREACINMMWQVPQYMLVTAGEILFSITGLELAYSQAPSSMTAVISAAWLMTDATGNLFTILVIGSISPLLSQVQEFLFFAAMCALATLLLLWVGRGFAYVESCDEVPGEETAEEQRA